MNVIADHGLLRTILERPRDDAARLIYADWLDDQGEAKRAEFIRVQCELAAMSKPPTLDRQMEVGRSRAEQNWGPVEDYVSACRDDERELHLRRRERELKDTLFIPLWDGERPGEAANIGAIFRRGFADEIACKLADWCGGACTRSARRPPTGRERRACYDGTIWDRGELVGTCSDCSGAGCVIAKGPAIMAAQPVTRVSLTDKHPAQNQMRPGRWCWLHPDVPSGCESDSPRYGEYLACRLPREIFAMVEGGPGSVPRCKWYDSEQDALEAMSVALVRWARQKAGLPRQPDHYQAR